MVSTFTPDKLNRLANVQASSPRLMEPVLSLTYTHDGEGNILTRNENVYRYDELDRLVYAQVKGIFSDDLPARRGYVTGDFVGEKALDYSTGDATPVSFDYAASSVGLDFGTTAQVRRVYLTKDTPASDTSRIMPNTLDLYGSADGSTFTRLDPATYTLKTTLDGFTFEFTEPQNLQQFKVHSKFDERGEDGAFTDKATFKNTLGELIKAEQEVSQATLEYGYDAAGNRTYERFTKASTHSKDYVYYANSNRLLTDGHYAFVYDEGGNLIKKGNKFTLAGETVHFTTDGKGVEYWEYTYNLRNQLSQVRKNGQLVAAYAYDGLGMRVSATTTITSKTTGQSKTTTRDYVFDLADRVIYDKVISTSGSLPAAEDPETSTENSYVFANGTHFAKVEGAIGSSAEIYYYHNDHLGSPMAITDNQGNLAWSQDYLPYGEALNESATTTRTRFTFTGKELDPATGLMYYNARWYDPDLGRFMTEDTYVGNPNEPRTLNRFTYVTSNPLKYIDPSGRDSTLVYQSEGSAYGSVTEDEIRNLQRIYDKAGIDVNAKEMFKDSGVKIRSARNVAEGTYRHTQVLKAFANPSAWADFIKTHGVEYSSQVLEEALRFVAWNGRVPSTVFQGGSVIVKVDGFFSNGQSAIFTFAGDGSVRVRSVPRAIDWVRVGWAAYDIARGGLEIVGGVAVATTTPTTGPVGAAGGAVLVVKGNADVALGLTELAFALTDTQEDAQQLVLGKYGSASWDVLNIFMGGSRGLKALKKAKPVEVLLEGHDAWRALKHLGRVKSVYVNLND